MRQWIEAVVVGGLALNIGSDWEESKAAAVVLRGQGYDGNL